MTAIPHRPDRLRAAPAPVVTGPGVVDEVDLRPVTADRAERIAPFVAWMATQDLDETARRAHREAVEAYLTWCRADDGPTTGRRRRYEVHLGRNAPQLLGPARDGLNRYAQYRQLVALTLPIDHH